MTIDVSVSRNHSRIAINFTVVNPTSMTSIASKSSLVMILFANIMTELTMNSSLLMRFMVMMVVMLLRVCSRWSNQH